MTARISSITNAFVSAVLPVIPPREEEIAEALAILQIDRADMRCAYCGDPSSEWDHLRPIVLDRRPTGFISEIANLVPSCGKCNQSKRNENWKKWMLSSVDLSPTARGIPDVADRIARLDRFEQWRTPVRVDFVSIVGSDVWTHYWEQYERVVGDLRNCQQFADTIKTQINGAIRRDPEIVSPKDDAKDVLAPVPRLRDLAKESAEDPPAE